MWMSIGGMKKAIPSYDIAYAQSGIGIEPILLSFERACGYLFTKKVLEIACTTFDLITAVLSVNYAEANQG